MDIARVEDFFAEYPQWKDLKIGQIVSDEYCFYRRTGKRNGGVYVQRYPKIYGWDYYKKRYFERAMAKRGRRHPHQKSLELIVNE
jgi:hypothetical protein